jgi:hypothetical protein
MPFYKRFQAIVWNPGVHIDYFKKIQMTDKMAQAPI